MKNNRDCDGHCNVHRFVACQNTSSRGADSLCNKPPQNDLSHHDPNPHGVEQATRLGNDSKKRAEETGYEDFIEQLENIKAQLDEDELIEKMRAYVALLEKAVAKKKTSARNARVKKKVLSPGEVFGEVAKLFNVRKAPCKAARHLEAAIEDGAFNSLNGIVEKRGFNVSEDKGFT